MRIDKTIELVRARNGKFSSMGQGASNTVIAVLEKQYKTVSITTINTLKDLESLIERKPDLVFLTVKRIPISADDLDNTVWVSDVLAKAGINHTGSLGEAISLDYDKTRAKDIVLDAGYSTSGYFIAKPGDFLNAESIPLQFPLFIKPTSLGNKKGVDAESVVHNYKDYVSKVQSLATNFRSDSLVEPFLSGREFSVAVIQKHASEPLESLPIEIVIGKNDNGDRILGATAHSGDDEVISIVEDPALHASLQSLAEGVFTALGARDYGRIDIRLNSEGQPQFLEANLIPGLSTSSFYPIANKLYNDLSYEDTILQIVSTAFDRHIA